MHWTQYFEKKNQAKKITPKWIWSNKKVCSIKITENFQRWIINSNMEIKLQKKQDNDFGILEDTFLEGKCIGKFIY